jgi:hypothetical protein
MIGYLHYVKVEASHSYIKRAYMSMHAAKSVYPVKAMAKPRMPIYNSICIFFWRQGNKVSVKANMLLFFVKTQTCY